MRTIPTLFKESVDLFHSNTFLLEDKGQGYYETTYAETATQVNILACALLDLGVEKGDRLAILSEGRNQWIISELAILSCGAVNVPLSVKLTELEVMFRLKHAGVKYIFASGIHAPKIRAVMDQLPEALKLIVFDEVENPLPFEMNYSALYASGKEVHHTLQDSLDKRISEVQENDYANICYTSGTTADPKGIILSHLNYYANVYQSYTLMDIPPTYRTLILLPLDHSFAHTAGFYAFMRKGAGVGFIKLGKTSNELLRNITYSIQAIKPNLLMSVPALAKTFKKSIVNGVNEKGKLTSWLLWSGLKVAYAYYKEGYNKGTGISLLLKPLVWMYDKLVFSKIRNFFGGNLKFFIGGGALLDIALQRFYYALGIPMMQGYGLSEASPVISSNALHKHKLGSSGVLVTPMELKIVDNDRKELPVGEKGEIAIRGENVMVGYWKNKQATDEVISDGWLYTGDLGYMDKEGFLFVLGRFKSLLISNDGEKYSPEGIEETLVQHSSLIQDIMLYNDQKPYTIALVYPNFDALKSMVSKRGVTPNSIRGVDIALQLLKEEIDPYLAGGRHESLFSDRWLPVALGVLPEGFSQENGFMNSTMKMVRGKITTHYRDLIAYLYTPEGKPVHNEKNKTIMRARL
ncbi:MAG: AMP-binding protein [Bacteroidales bacterium]|nr:AMP-binding protein [Bacteroidales bacterium]MDD3010798.1 AMP-binding protein [Bacteroidales bacterium]